MTNGDEQIQQIIRIECPECRASFRIKSKFLGRKVACSKCSANFQAEAIPVKEPAKAVPKRAKETVSFSQWYKSRPGQWSLIVQIISWVFYGYIWIPCWWAFSQGYKKIAISLGVILLLALFSVANLQRDKAQSAKPLTQDYSQAEDRTPSEPKHDKFKSLDLSKYALVILSAGPKWDFDKNSARHTDDWFDLLFIQIKQAHEMGNQLIYDEVYNAIEYQLNMIVGESVKWDAIVDQITLDHIVLSRQLLYITHNELAVPCEHFLVESKGDRGKYLISLEEDNIKAIASNLYKGEVVEITGSIDSWHIPEKPYQFTKPKITIDLTELLIRKK